MSTKSSRRIMMATLVVASVLGVIGVLVNLSQESGDVFHIPLPASVTGTNQNPDVECRYRTVMDIIDAGGNTIRATTTNSIFANPTFSVVDVQSGKSMAGYVVEPMAGCNSLNLPITIDKSAMTAIFEAKDKNGAWVTVATKSFYTAPVSYPKLFGIGVKPLGYTSILSQLVEDKVGSGFTSEVRVKVTGVLNIYYTDYAGARFYYQINAGQSTVYGGQIKLVSPTQVTDPNTKDVDADGILDIYDNCDTQKEVYNGYKDGDGCPDTLPTTTDPSTCTAPKVLISGVCSDPPPPDVDEGDICISTATTTCPVSDNPVDTTEECQAKYGSATEKYAWDVTNSLCKPVATTSGDGDVTGITNAYILVSPKYRDGTQQGFTLPLEGQTPLTIDFNPQELIASFDGANAKGIAEIDLEVFVETAGATSWKVKSHSVLLKPTIRVAGTDIKLNDELFVGYSTTNSKTLTIPKAISGSISFVGLSLGKADILASDIELKVSKDLVPEGQRRDLKLSALIAGTVTLESNSGSVIVGELKDGKLDWQMEIERKTSNIITDRYCEEGQYAVATTGDIKCVDFGSPPPEQNAGLCTIGQAGCEICTDSGSGSGGFPCTQKYRDTYCGGKNQCLAPPPDDRKKIDDAPDGCSDSPINPASCISTPIDPQGIPKGLNGGFNQSNIFGATDFNSLALMFGIVGIVVGIGIIIYKKSG